MCGCVCIMMCVDAYRLRSNSIGPVGATALATSLGSLTSLQSLSYVVSGVVMRGWCGGVVDDVHVMSHGVTCVWSSGERLGSRAASHSAQHYVV